MPFRSVAQRKYMFAKHPKIAEEFARHTPKGANLPQRVKSKKKLKISINSKLKSTMGQINLDSKGKVVGNRGLHIQVNVKAHKKKGKLDRAELASTIKHELLHAKHPTMPEKEIYKQTSKSKIPFNEQQKLISRLRMKKMNYKFGAAKRKLKMTKDDKVEPGTFISKMNAQKTPRTAKELPKNPTLRTAIMGAV